MQQQMQQQQQEQEQHQCKHDHHGGREEGVDAVAWQQVAAPTHPAASFLHFRLLTWRQVLAAKALKQQQQQKKQQLQEAASATADAVKQAVLQQEVERIEDDEAQEEKIMEKLRRIGRCPAGARCSRARAIGRYGVVVTICQGSFGTRWRAGTDARAAAISSRTSS